MKISELSQIDLQNISNIETINSAESLLYELSLNESEAVRNIANRKLAQLGNNPVYQQMILEKLNVNDEKVVKQIIKEEKIEHQIYQRNTNAGIKIEERKREMSKNEEIEKAFEKLTLNQQKEILHFESLFKAELQHQLREFIFSKGSVEEKTEQWQNILQKELNNKLKIEKKTAGDGSSYSSFSKENKEEDLKKVSHLSDEGQKISLKNGNIDGAAAQTITANAADATVAQKQAEKKITDLKNQYKALEYAGYTILPLGDGGEEKRKFDQNVEQQKNEEKTRVFINANKSELLGNFTQRITRIENASNISEEEKEKRISEITHQLSENIKDKMKQEGIDFNQLSVEKRIQLLRDEELTNKEQALLFDAFGIPKEKYQSLLEEQNKKNEEKTMNSKLSEEEQFRKIQKGMVMYEKQSDAQKKDIFSYLHKEEGYTLSQKRYEELLAKENKKENTEKYNEKNPKEYTDKVTENGNLSATIEKHPNVGEKVKTQDNIEVEKNNVAIVELNNGSKH